MQIHKMAVQKFWKKLSVLENIEPYKYIMKTACSTFSQLSIVVHKVPHGVKKKCLAVGPVRNKAVVEKVIGLYLNSTKLMAKLITEYTSFNHVDEHYAYTLPHGDDVTFDNNVLDADDDKLGDSDEVMEVEDENMPCFNSIT